MQTMMSFELVSRCTRPGTARSWWELGEVVLDVVLVTVGFFDLKSYLEEARRVEESKHEYYKTVLKSALNTCQKASTADHDSNGSDWRPELRNSEVTAHNKMLAGKSSHTRWTSILEWSAKWLSVAAGASIVVALVQIPTSSAVLPWVTYLVKACLVPTNVIVVSKQTDKARKRLEESLKELWRLKV